MFWSQMVSSFVSTLASTAHAQAAGAPAAGQAPWFMQIVPMVLIFAVFYFLLIVPQRNQKKKHVEFLTKLKRGDEVLTASGIFGRVEGITDRFITLEVANDVKIKILKTQIMGAPKENA